MRFGAFLRMKASWFEGCTTMVAAPAGTATAHANARATPMAERERRSTGRASFLEAAAAGGLHGVVRVTALGAACSDSAAAWQKGVGSSCSRVFSIGPARDAGNSTSYSPETRDFSRQDGARLASQISGCSSVEPSAMFANPADADPDLRHAAERVLR